MSRLFKLKVAIFLCGVLLCNSLYGQFLEGVGDRASVKWRQMSGPTYKVIYPKGEDSLALKYLWLLEQNREATMLGLGLDKSAKVPVVLHNRTANSNGLVTWAPKRMELYTIPPTDTYSHIWEEQLAIHEARHVGQMTYFTKGIFNVLQYFIGEQSQGLGAGVYGSEWNMEGDAVVAETELTNSGRGREADFLEYHRLSILQGDLRRPQDWKFGSYKHYSSSLYQFGYLINSAIRYNIDDYAISGKIFDKTVKKFYTPVVKKVVYKSLTGKSYQEQFKTAQSLMDSIWREDLTHRGNFTEPEQLLNKTTDYYVKYESPVVLSADSVLYVKSSYENSSELVLVTGGKEKVLKPFSTQITRLVKKGDKVYFTERVMHHRWAADVYSNLYSLDLNNLKISKVTKNHWYYYPSVSDNTNNILLIEYLPNSGSRLVVLNPNRQAKSFEDIVSVISTPENSQVTSAVWSGSSIYLTALSPMGLAMYKADYCFKTNTLLSDWEMVINPQTAKISDLMDGGDYIYFLSDMDGLNNVYKLQNGKLERITNEKFGAHSPYVHNGYVYYSAAQSDGNYPVKAQICSASEYNSKRDVTLKDGNLENRYVYPIAEKLTSQAKEALAAKGLLRDGNDKSNFQSASIVKFKKSKEEFAKEVKSTRYSRVGHLFKIHSWAPVYYDVDNIMAANFDKIDEIATLGAVLYSQNTLGNAIAKFGYSYHNNRHAGHFKFVYTGLYPVFEINTDINANGQKRYLYKNGGKLAIQNTGNVDVNLDVTAYIPFTFNSHGLYRGITPQINWNFTNNYFTNETYNVKSYNQELTFAIQGYLMRPTAHSAIYPKWGIGLYAGTSMTPKGGDFKGNAAALYAYGYVPGLFSKHGIKLTMGYQRQWTKLFYMSNLISGPRGYKESIYADKLLTASVDYALPIYAGNLYIPSLLFVKRFQLNPFCDFANATYAYNSTAKGLSFQHYSFGATLKVDCHILGFGAPISVGVRYARNYTEDLFVSEFKKNSVNLVLSVEL